MKIKILSPDAEGKIDGTITNQILNHIPHQVDSIAECDVVLIPVSFFADYRFNTKLNQVNKPWVCIDFLEYSTFWDKQETHLLGRNLEVAKNLRDNPEWQRLDEWVRDNPPAMYFKRELLQENANARIKPIEFLCYLPAEPLQTKEQFDARPFDALHIWGYSHESRPRLHADIFKAMATDGIGVISDWSHAYPYLNNPHPGRTYVSIYSPYYVRKPIAEMLWWHERSKLMVSLPGAGQKCFRSAETVNTVHALHYEHYDRFAWSYPWNDGENCIRLQPGNEYNCLKAAAEWDKLYSIYVEGQRNLDNYRPSNYVPKYLLPAIREVL